MNVDDLIYRVHKNPPIWDKRIKAHGSRPIVDACWKNISAAMKIEDYKLKKKWKYLRDQFCTEFYKGQQITPESAVVQKWQYFNQLMFLKDVIKPTSNRSIRLSRNLNPTSDDDDEVDVNPILDLECVVVNGPDEEADTNSREDNNEYHPPETLNGSATRLPTREDREEKAAYQPVKRRLKRDEDTFYNKRSLLEEDNSSSQQYVSHHESDNDDLLFLKSLLPFVSNIPMDRKLRFRIQMLNLVDEFTSSPQPHTSAGPNSSKPEMSAPTGNRYENNMSETLLGDGECPQDVKGLVANVGKHCMFAYKRIDAKIAWPRTTSPQ